MTPDQLNQILNDMEQAAAGNADLMPGLITVQTNDWIGTVWEVRATCSALHDGLRHRNVVIHIGGGQKTEVLTRTAAGERGEPYRDLTAGNAKSPSPRAG